MSGWPEGRGVKLWGDPGGLCAVGCMDGASLTVLHVMSASVGQVGRVVVMVGNGPHHPCDPHVMGALHDFDPATASSTKATSSIRLHWMVVGRHCQTL